MMSQCFGGTRWREGRFRAVCVGGSLDSVLWWIALARRQFLGRVCWSERNRSVPFALGRMLFMLPS